MNEPSGPLSWRDVYRAVGESEARIIASVNAAVAPLNTASADHELRLRNIEQVTNSVPSMQVQETALAMRVTALETHNAKESGVFTTLGAGKTFALFLLAIVSPALSIIALLSK